MSRPGASSAVHPPSGINQKPQSSHVHGAPPVDAFHAALNPADRIVYQRLAAVKSQRRARGAPTPRVVVITDMDKDYDDLLAVLFLAEMHHEGIIELAGCIANHKPADKRACFLRSVLDLAGLPNVEVAQGTAGAARPDHLEEAFYELRCTTFEDYGRRTRFRAGQQLLEQLASQGPTQKKEPLTVVLLSALQDISQFLQSTPYKGANMSAAFRKFVSQGGYVMDKAGNLVDADPGPFNKATNLPAAQHFVKVLKESRVPSEAWTSAIAVSGSIDADLFLGLSRQSHGPIGEHLAWLWDRQEFAFYWCAFNKRFMYRLDPEWYAKTRLGMQPGSEALNRFLAAVANPKSAESKKMLDFFELEKKVKIVPYDAYAAFGALGDDVLQGLGIITQAQNQGGLHRQFDKTSIGPNGIGINALKIAFSACFRGALLRSNKYYNVNRTRFNFPSPLQHSKLAYKNVNVAQFMKDFELQRPYLLEYSKYFQTTLSKDASEKDKAAARAALEALKSECVPGTKVPKICGEVPMADLFEVAKAAPANPRAATPQPPSQPSQSVNRVAATSHAQSNNKSMVTSHATTPAKGAMMSQQQTANKGPAVLPTRTRAPAPGQGPLKR